MSKRVVLTATDFGKRIAEEEVNALESYFVETEQWRKVFAGEIDVIYGPKGSGKSAIYSLLVKKAQELKLRNVLVVPGENVMGTPVFRDLVNEHSSSEEQLRGLSKLYCLSLVAQTFRSRQIQNGEAKKVVEAMEAAGLVAAGWSLKRMFRSAMEYVRGLQLSGEVKINPNTGMPEGFGGKITLGEPTGEQQKQGFLSADLLLELADKALAQVGLKIWIVLDRLDVAFLDSEELEARALRALFRFYLDINGFESIFLKIFLRDDIWGRITEGGFREASHITRYTRIVWDEQTLLNLIIRRALHNQSLREYCNVDRDEVLSNAALQRKVFYRIFPPQVDPGAGKTTTLDWMLSRTRDGSKQTAPREVIHLLSSAREQQLKLLELGSLEPPDEILVDRSALKAALPEVSNERFHQTLCAEHAALKTQLFSFEGKKTQQTAKTLAKMWGITEPEALARAERLAEIGFFEKRIVKERIVFWVPFIYRDALKMIQGQAK